MLMRDSTDSSWFMGIKALASMGKARAHCNDIGHCLVEGKGLWSGSGSDSCSLALLAMPDQSRSRRTHDFIGFQLWLMGKAGIARS